MFFLKKQKPAHEELQLMLNLQPGDIVLSELPFADAHIEDFRCFKEINPVHTCVWTGNPIHKPFVRALQEAHQFPGLQLMGFWPGKHLIYRYVSDPVIPQSTAQMLWNWASNAMVEADPHVQAVDVLLALFRNNQPTHITQNGVQLVMQYAAMREWRNEPVHHKAAQRCTAIVAVAFQASVLASIVKANLEKGIFEKHAGKSILECAEEMLIAGWENTHIGQKLITAVEKDNFNDLFPKPFAMDHRYIKPRALYERLQTSDDFTYVGAYSYFKDKIISIERNLRPLEPKLA